MSSPTARRAASSRRSVVGVVVGSVLLVVGLAVLGWFGYQFIGTTVVSRQAFEGTTKVLEQQWTQPSQAAPGAGSEAGAGATAVPVPRAGSAAAEPKSGDVRPDGTLTRIPGDAIAIMRVPAWGTNWAVPILDGTEEDTLAKGLGWYENTVGPGQVGTFAVAGHVVTHGQPFSGLARLPMGSQVQVETRDSIYTYVLDSSTQVVDTDTWVLDPVPGRPEQRPTQELITLTTCADIFRSPNRHIVFGHLVSVTTK